ncbi:AraC family transcriptional regulator [Alicyclobacillus tolerans]|uniref:YesN/AraC family two-component response regulator n=1 Tax=Alicyclobacillus tolerans TaxID=90970 RepID=A0ABT9LSA7_9BACL|nr:helix-turn-helix domain-containing protein [Alicyclobacillus tengchongensis]MDP9727148.1 YesN/AraC family two-component response regulator [Alicyclobacillus tengchongensis]
MKKPYDWQRVQSEEYLLRHWILGQPLSAKMLWNILSDLDWQQAPHQVMVLRWQLDKEAQIFLGDTQKFTIRQHITEIARDYIPQCLQIWQEEDEWISFPHYHSVLNEENLSNMLQAILASLPIPLPVRLFIGVEKVVDTVVQIPQALRLARRVALQAMEHQIQILSVEEMELDLDHCDAPNHHAEKNDDQPIPAWQTHDTRETPAISPIVEQAVAYIHSHLQSALTLPEIAVQVAVSRFHLSHLFRQHLQTTVTSYVRSARLAKAAELLANSDKSINEVADAVGMADANYFSKCFRATYALSPSEFRRHKKASIQE